MGKMKGGKMSGAAGNVVFYSYNDTEYFRAIPRKRTKSSWSERQVLNRSRFSALSAFWMQFKNTPIRQIWQVAEKGRKGNCLFLSINTPAFGPEGSLVDPQRLHFSAGQLPQVHKLTVNRVSGEPDKIEVTWQDDPGKGIARGDDELMMMVSHDSKFMGPIATGTIRRQESAIIQLPIGIGSVQGIYLFFGSEKRKLYSPDIYFGL